MKIISACQQVGNLAKPIEVEVDVVLESGETGLGQCTMQVKTIHGREMQDRTIKSC